MIYAYLCVCRFDNQQVVFFADTEEACAMKLHKYLNKMESVPEVMIIGTIEEIELDRMVWNIHAKAEPPFFEVG